MNDFVSQQIEFLQQHCFVPFRYTITPNSILLEPTDELNYLENYCSLKQFVRDHWNGRMSYSNKACIVSIIIDEYSKCFELEVHDAQT